jgi:predicted glycoside hydrolase/deacetylase ChbG (UPF0249 family)
LHYLILSADDLGMTNGVTAGIVESMTRGVVATCAAMACVPGSLERVRDCAAAIDGRIGMHLQLTDGEPCLGATAVPSLVDESGRFPRSWKGVHDLAVDDVRREWGAQMERLLDLGLRPSHIDTHHHVHRFPEAFRVYCELARKYDLPVRTIYEECTTALRRRGVRCADYCETGWWKSDLSPESLVSLAQSRSEEVVEVLCHPAYCDDELREKSTYAEERERELRALCDPALPGLLAQAGIQLVSRAAGYERC